MFGKKKKKFACDSCKHFVRFSSSVLWCNKQKSITDLKEKCENKEKIK